MTARARRAPSGSTSTTSTLRWSGSRSSPPASTEPFGNDAWAAAHRVEDGSRSATSTGCSPSSAPPTCTTTTGSGVWMHFLGDEAVDGFRWMLDLDQLRYVRELVATRGDGLALTRDTVSFVDGNSGPAEVQALTVVLVRERGSRRLRRVRREPARRGLPRAGRPPRRTGRDGPRPAAEAFAARDWDRLATLFEPGCTFEDRRADASGRFDRDGLVGAAPGAGGGDRRRPSCASTTSGRRGAALVVGPRLRRARSAAGRRGRLPRSPRPCDGGAPLRPRRRRACASPTSHGACSRPAASSSPTSRPGGGPPA